MLVLGVLAAVLVVVVVIGLVRYLGAVPQPRLSVDALSARFPGAPPALPWPAGAEGTLGLEGAGTIASTGGETPSPIASVTKLMAALAVLHDHPLGPGEEGPLISVTADDVATYNRELAQGDSVVAVRAGEQLSELQALEAALVPSADNVIELLARWDAGSTSAFTSKMNAMATGLGLSHTHYSGPSGVDPTNVSTATDQARVASVVLRNAVLARIVSLPQVTLPEVGVAYNVDGDLGKDGIVGVKTGWVPQGGASFVFAARHQADGRPVTVLGAVVGVQGRTPIPTALAAARRLSLAGAAALTTRALVSAGQTVGTLSSPWAAPVPVVAARTAELLGWPGAAAVTTTHLVHGITAPVRSGTRIGELVVSLGNERASVPLVTARRLDGPSFTWRLTR